MTIGKMGDRALAVRTDLFAVGFVTLLMAGCSGGLGDSPTSVGGDSTSEPEPCTGDLATTTSTPAASPTPSAVTPAAPSDSSGAMAPAPEPSMSTQTPPPSAPGTVPVADAGATAPGALDPSGEDEHGDPSQRDAGVDEPSGADSDPVSPSGMPSADAGAASPPPTEPIPPDVMQALDPLGADPVCTSDDFFIGEEGERMRPGEACVSCHAREGEGPRFSIAGTLYPSGHEPDDCVGVTPAAGARVVITDADGEVMELSVNSSGNFRSSTSIALPYTAKVVTADGERPMFGAQTVGDCNSCHTQAGAQGAPGRITLPFAGN